MMTVTDGPTPAINTTQDLRIRIPAALNMTFDATVTTVTLGGAAAAGVTVTGVSEVGDGIFRYTFSGSFATGTVDVDFLPGTWDEIGRAHV